MHQNDFEIPCHNKRDLLTKYVRDEFLAIKNLNSEEAYTDTLNDFYRPHFYIMRNYDYTCDDPVHRQTKLEIEYQLELWMVGLIIKQR